MDRRDLLKSVAGIAAASGVANTASAFDMPTGKPALLLIECEHPIPTERAAWLMQTLQDGMKDTAFEDVKCVVLSDGMKLTILDAAGHVLNRTVVDA